MKKFRKRAFTLVEIMIAMAVLSMFTIAIMKIWTRTNKAQMRGVWLATKQKELRFASKLIQESISSATIPSIVTTKGTFFINQSGTALQKVGDSFTADFLVTFNSSAAYSGTTFTNGVLSIFYPNIGTKTFGDTSFDNTIGFASETQLLQNITGGNPANIARVGLNTPLASPTPILRWLECKPSILSSPGEIKVGYLVLEQSLRGTYKLYLCKSTPSTITNNGPTNATISPAPALTYSSITSFSKKILLVDNVVRIEISAYMLPNEPKLSDCSTDSGTQYYRVNAGSNVTITTDSSTTTNILSSTAAEMDARRKFMLYIKIACAMSGYPKQSNKLYYADSFYFETNCAVVTNTGL